MFLLFIATVLAVLKKHCPRLCDCLPEDYRKTLDRIRMRATVPEGLVQQLAILPSPKKVNHHIVAAMLRPLTNEAGVLGFCDLMESVLDNEQSLVFIERIRNGKFCKHCSLVKFQHEKIFVGRQVRRKLNTWKFSYHKEIEQFIMVCSLLRRKFFTMDFFLMNISNH